MDAQLKPGPDVQYAQIRKRSTEICAPLQTEDYVVQPVVDVSPPKWHLGHTTWFFETFLLKPQLQHYREFHPSYNFIFNSYYETIGARVLRTDRGNLTRPAVEEVYAYRDYVDEHMLRLLRSGLKPSLLPVYQLGLNHEQQHQELLITDIKYILGHNPLFPAYDPAFSESGGAAPESRMIPVEAGAYRIGYRGSEFCFDNELAAHDVHLPAFEICSALVTNSEYLAFIEAGGYSDFRWWHAEGWDWVRRESITAPMYWHRIDGEWWRYSLAGLQKPEPSEPVTHVSFYEASAYAAWKGMRLPTELEWEAAAPFLNWGSRWEWCNSAYLPYPGYKREAGAIGEYNGKFMVNQMILRGASVATPPGHSRPSYRNFFHPHLRWQFCGIRLAR